MIGNGRGRHEVVVQVGLRRHAQWYRNVIAGGAVELAIGTERLGPHYRELPTRGSSSGPRRLERRNRPLAPDVRRVLSRLLG